MTTDITELAQKRHSAISQLTAAFEPGHINQREVDALAAAVDVMNELVEALEKAQTNANLTEAERQAYLLIINDRDARIAELEQEHCGGALMERELVHSEVTRKLMSEIDNRDSRIAELEPIRAAAEKLVRCKGRYHSEQNYRTLAALFGVNTPDLPPLDAHPSQPCEHSMFWDASGVKRCSKCDIPEHANVHYADAAEIEIAALRQRIAELDSRTVTTAATDVLAERQRQVTAEGWSPGHDDNHDNNELAFAASCYAFHAAAASWDLEDDDIPYDSHPVPKQWPWESAWWKPTNPRRDLVKAGALILAEIERLDRAAGIKVEGE